SHRLRCPLGKAFTLPSSESLEGLLLRLHRDVFAELPPIARLRTVDQAEIIDIAFILRGDRFAEEWISLNVGGVLMTTTRSSLTNNSPESVLARMFAQGQQNNAYLLDRTPAYFAPLLHYLRTGSLVLDCGVHPLGVLEEAKYLALRRLFQSWRAG
ncbi:Uncharacterized protein FKW44_010827, partial [Caligus rogercresseyi]